MKKAAHQIDRCGIGPLEIIERKHKRTLVSQQLQQPVKCTQDLMALVGVGLTGCAFALWSERREDRCEQHALLVIDQPALLWRQRADSSFQRVGEGGER